MLDSKQFQTPERLQTPRRLQTPGRLEAPRRLEFNKDRSIETFFVTYLLTSFSDISSDILSDILSDHVCSLNGIHIRSESRPFMHGMFQCSRSNGGSHVSS